MPVYNPKIQYNTRSNYMEKYTGVFTNFSYGAKKQYTRKAIIKVLNLEPSELGKIIGWLVSWPENEPKLTGRIIGKHGRTGSLMVQFKHGLPGYALGDKLAISKMKLKTEITLEENKKIDHGSKIIEIEGIGPKNAEKLHLENIYTTIDLLEAGATPIKRKELAEKTNISEKLILKWVNNSDLFRIKGVGEEYADLLEEAGVDTVIELSTRNAANLHTKILEINKAKKIVRRVPSLAMVGNWIEETNTLPRKIEY